MPSLAYTIYITVYLLEISWQSKLAKISEPDFDKEKDPKSISHIRF